MYTWGQIRLVLKQFAPGVSDDQIDEFINARYQEILDSCSWKGVEVDAVLQTVAAYNTGTVNVTQGSQTITGNGTNWTSAMSGMKLYLPGIQPPSAYLMLQPQGSPLYTLTYVNATQMTLDRPFEGETANNSGYWICQNIYKLPSDCKALKSILSPATGTPLSERSSLNLDQSAGFRVPGIPEAYAVRADSQDPSIEPLRPSFHQIELFPIPVLAQGYSITYFSSAYGFDGGNTGDSPLAWVNDTGLINGVRADLKAIAGDLPAAQLYESKFQHALALMMRVEQRRTANRPAILPRRYFRHRLTRLTR